MCDRGFVNLDGKLPNSKISTMNGKKETDPLTGVVSITKETSSISMLKRCNDFKNEVKQIMLICNSLNVLL